MGVVELSNLLTLLIELTVGGFAIGISVLFYKKQKKESEKSEEIQYLQQKVFNLQHQVNSKEQEIMNRNVRKLIKSQSNLLVKYLETLDKTKSFIKHESNRQLKTLERDLHYRKRDLNGFISTTKHTLETIREYKLLSSDNSSDPQIKKDIKSIKNELTTQIHFWLRGVENLQVNTPEFDVIFTVTEPILKKFRSELADKSIVHNKSDISRILNQVKMLESIKKFIEDQITTIENEISNLKKNNLN